MQKIRNQPLRVEEKERNMRQYDKRNHKNSSIKHFFIARIRQRQIEPNAPQTNVKNDCFIFIWDDIFHRKCIVLKILILDKSTILFDKLR